jgi:hypothetical protein
MSDDDDDERACNNKSKIFGRQTDMFGWSEQDLVFSLFSLNRRFSPSHDCYDDDDDVRARTRNHDNMKQ